MWDAEDQKGGMVRIRKVGFWGSELWMLRRRTVRYKGAEKWDSEEQKGGILRSRKGGMLRIRKVGFWEAEVWYGED